MSDPAFQIRIRADKSGPEPDRSKGESWPAVGIELPDPLPETLSLPTSILRNHALRPWLSPEGDTIVERPSRPAPDVDKKGSTTVSQAHRLTDDGPAPHAWLHLDRFVFETLNHGTVVYEVDRQPDKYVDSDDDTEQVTAEVYAEGRTRVDNFYICHLASTGKES